jgi:hypothetical protein
VPVAFLEWLEHLPFLTESDDPAAVPRDAKPSTSTNPLAGLYGGWQAVENSSLALLESADLLNLRGRVCANGRPVPVDESQWKAAVEAMREAARASGADERSSNLTIVNVPVARASRPVPFSIVATSVILGSPLVEAKGNGQPHVGAFLEEGFGAEEGRVDAKVACHVEASPG